MSSMSAYLMAVARSLLLILIICELAGKWVVVGSVMVVDIGAKFDDISGVMADISKIFAPDAVFNAGTFTVSSIIALSSGFFSPEYLMRGCGLLLTVVNNN